MRKKKTVELDEYLSPVDLATYELARAKLEIARRAIEILELRSEKERRAALDRLESIKNEHSARAADIARISKEIAEIQANLGVRYSVNMATMSYDDVTGKITRG